MKRFLLLLLALSLLAVSVGADVLIELDDSFWSVHQDDCEYLYRAYTVNSPEGYAALYESPASSRQRETVANGERLAGTWLYTDAAGETWLAVYGDGFTERGEEVRGWVRTSECLPVPDYISFEEAHGDEFIQWEPSFSDTILKADEVCLWDYPGCGTEPQKVDADWFRNNPDDMFATCWKDDQGRVWAFSVYCYGIRNKWICLSDPTNDALEADENAVKNDAVIYPPASNPPAPTSGVAPLTVGLVAAVAVVTAVLLAVLLRRRPAQRTENS